MAASHAKRLLLISFRILALNCALEPNKHTSSKEKPSRLVLITQITGLKVNDQLVAYATRFLAVRLKKYVWSHHRALKAKVQCDFSSAYSPGHTNVL